MRGCLLFVLSVVLLAGCTQVDENPDWNPKVDYPGWAYDAPFYYRPTEELKPLENVGQDIGVYYTRNEYFFIRHPGGSQVDGAPRVAVWCSDNAGEKWSKSGYFGVEQSHFLFKATGDGKYWIRFVGPGQGVSEVPPGMPHRIYVVDTQPPGVQVTVTPGPWKDKDKTIPRIYKAGEQVTVHWSVGDVNLAEGTVRLGVCFARFPNNLIWSRFPDALPPVGSMKVEIPPEAVREGGLRFRIEGVDKSGNVGMGLSQVLRVARSGKDGPQLAVRPVGKFEPVPPVSELRDKKKGWPESGRLLRGGTTQVLEWMPPAAEKYDTIEMHFSSTDGRIWRTLASGLKYGRKLKWTVPRVTAKHCRLRIVAIEENGIQTPLAISPAFVVDTVVRNDSTGFTADGSPKPK